MIRWYTSENHQTKNDLPMPYTKSIPWKFISLFFIIIVAGKVCLAQQGTEDFQVKGIPQKISWQTAPQSWKCDGDQLTILAGAKTDLFLDPQNAYEIVNSPKAVFNPNDSFVLSARVRVDFNTDYDAGVLVLYADDKNWAKLCFEYSPQKIPFVVSVVNKGISDDCNHVPVNGRAVFLRIAGLGNHIFAFHYSDDGEHWNLVRYFSLGNASNVRVGFSSQSPTGSSCRAVFSGIRYRVHALADIRNGE